MTDIGKVTTERIRYQARIMKPINDEGKFRNLSESWIKKRKYFSNYNVVHPTFEYRRSNVTLIGAFLNSLGFDITGPGEITLKFVGQHPGYKDETGKVSTSRPMMQDLYQYLFDIDLKAYTIKGLREFVPLQKRLSTLVSAAIRRSFKQS